MWSDLTHVMHLHVCSFTLIYAGLRWWGLDTSHLDQNRLTADKTGTTRRWIILRCSRGLFGDHAPSDRSLYCSQMFLNKWIYFKNVDIHREPARPGAHIFAMCVQKDIVFGEMERVQNLVWCRFKAWFCAPTWHAEIMQMAMLRRLSGIELYTFTP